MGDVDDLRERITKLEAMNDHLLQRVVELGIEVQRTRAGGFRSMRDSRRCPGCSEGALVHVRRAEQCSQLGIADFGLTLVHSKWTGRTKVFGTMEAYACRNCGLVEWHVTDWKGITPDGDRLVEILPEGDAPSDGPFR